MMKRNFPPFMIRSLFFFCVLTVILVLTGCASTIPVHYYLLSAVTEVKSETAGSMNGDMVIGIGPVILPEYLDRPQMLIRLSENRVQLSESNRWTEPLAVNILHVIREDLSLLLQTEHLLLYPWEKRTRVTYQLVIDVFRFEGDGMRRGYLESTWSIRDDEGKILFPPHRSRYAVANPSQDYDGLASALSRTLFNLCQEIVQTLSQYTKTGN